MRRSLLHPPPAKFWMVPPTTSTRRRVTPGALTTMLPSTTRTSVTTAPARFTSRVPWTVRRGFQPCGTPAERSVGQALAFLAAPGDAESPTSSEAIRTTTVPRPAARERWGNDIRGQLSGPETIGCHAEAPGGVPLPMRRNATHCAQGIRPVANRARRGSVGRRDADLDPLRVEGDVLGDLRHGRV